jgi:hypothetical protein
MCSDRNIAAIAIAWSARCRLRGAASKSVSWLNWRSAPRQMRFSASTALTGYLPAADSCVDAHPVGRVEQRLRVRLHATGGLGADHRGEQVADAVVLQEALHARRAAGGDGHHRVMRGQFVQHLLHPGDHLVRYLVDRLRIARASRVALPVADRLQARAQAVDGHVQPQLVEHGVGAVHRRLQAHHQLARQALAAPAVDTGDGIEQARQLRDQVIVGVGDRSVDVEAQGAHPQQVQGHAPRIEEWRVAVAPYRASCGMKLTCAGRPGKASAGSTSAVSASSRPWRHTFRRCARRRIASTTSRACSRTKLASQPGARP